MTTSLADIKKTITALERKYGREKNTVSLLAVSKKQSVEKILNLIKQGQRAFGENYLQEALDKMHDDLIVNCGEQIEWHFIGHIQRNKTKKIAEHFSWVHSVESFDIAERLSHQRPEQLSPLNICIEVNLDHEASKSGANIKAIPELAQAINGLPNIRLRGLMTIPKPRESLDAQHEPYHRLQVLFDSLNAAGLNLDTLSMGMSDDFEAAIAEGATIIRLGTALFGARE